MAKANEPKSTDSGKPRVCAGNKKWPICLWWGQFEIQLEREVEVVLWTVGKPKVKTLNLIQEAKRNQHQGILKQGGKSIYHACIG